MSHFTHWMFLVDPKQSFNRAIAGRDASHLALYLQATQEKVAAVMQAADLREQLRRAGHTPVAASPQTRGYAWGRVSLNFPSSG